MSYWWTRMRRGMIPRIGIGEQRCMPAGAISCSAAVSERQLRMYRRQKSEIEQPLERWGTKATQGRCECRLFCRVHLLWRNL